MNENENITSEEITETEVTVYDEKPSNTGLKVALGLGAAALVGTAVYKFAVKPVIAKFKKKKDVIIVDSENSEDDGNVAESDDAEEKK